MSFKNIGLIGRVDSPLVVESVKSLTKLLSSRNLNILFEKETSAVVDSHDYQVINRDEIGNVCDLVIVVGGDGSLLGAARDLSNYEIPLLGINRGKLGFLTDIAPNDVEEGVVKVLDGLYTIENRFLLEMSLLRGKKNIENADAFNDIVLHSGQAPKMLSFELSIDNDFVYSQRSDGLIVSTPTGSTAYSLSGGGPIVHPQLDAILLVPMYPHSLSSRPLVVDANSIIKITVNEVNPVSPHISCDGQVNMKVQPGDIFSIRKKNLDLKLIHPEGNNFFQTCRDKLGWGSQFIES